MPSSDKIRDEICGRDANGPQHQKIYQGGVSYSSGAVYDAGDCVEYCIHPLTRQHDDDVSSCQGKDGGITCKKA